MSFMVPICVVCGSAVAAPAKVCHACDAASVRAGAVGSPILSVRDFTALERFARLRLSPTGSAYAAIFSKLEQSRMLPVDAVMPGIASLGSRIVFSVDDRPAEGRMLVLPTRHSTARWTLPVTTPRGLALLGQAAGTVVTAIRRDGGAETLRLVAAMFEPDGAAADDASRDRRAAEQPAPGRPGTSRKPENPDRPAPAPSRAE